MSFEYVKKCNAKAKGSGEKCRNPAVSGSTKCRNHGGLSTGPKDKSHLENNTYAFKHGIYMKRLISDEEKRVYKEFYSRIESDFNLNESTDLMNCGMACLHFVRLLRAIDSGKEELIVQIDMLVRRQLQDLKATKDKREGDTITLKTTPAEWAANLLAKYREEKAKTDKTEKNSHICEKKSDASD